MLSDAEVSGSSTSSVQRPSAETTRLPTFEVEREPEAVAQRLRCQDLVAEPGCQHVALSQHHRMGDTRRDLVDVMRCALIPLWVNGYLTPTCVELADGSPRPTVRAAGC